MSTVYIFGNDTYEFYFLQSNFEAVCLQDIAPTPSLREPQAIIDASPGYHSRTLHLLDTGPLRGRLLLAAWDYGLTNVSDSVASFLQEAAKVLRYCLL